MAAPQYTREQLEQFRQKIQQIVFAGKGSPSVGAMGPTGRALQLVLLREDPELVAQIHAVVPADAVEITIAPDFPGVRHVRGGARRR